MSTVRIKVKICCIEIKNSTFSFNKFYIFVLKFFFLIFIYLAVLGLSCGMWDLVP